MEYNSLHTTGRIRKKKRRRTLNKKKANHQQKRFAQTDKSTGKENSHDLKEEEEVKKNARKGTEYMHRTDV